MAFVQVGSIIAVHASRRFAAPPERVFDAFLDTRLIARWMFGPDLREQEVVRLQLDPRVGGTFSFLVRRGEREVDHVGEYLEIQRPHRLQFTWGAREDLPATSHVRVDIDPFPAGSALSLTHELHPQWGAAAEATKDAWTKMLDALARALGDASRSGGS